jgi:hypothetical protein
MNHKQLNLELTVRLMNLAPEKISLGGIKEKVAEVDGTGKFLGIFKLGKKRMNNHWVNEKYTLQYENCTLNVDLASNRQTQSKVLSHVELR